MSQENLSAVHLPLRVGRPAGPSTHRAPYRPGGGGYGERAGGKPRLAEGPQLRAAFGRKVRDESSDRADAQQERLPPLLETAKGNIHGDGAGLRVAEPSLAEQL